MGCTLPLITQVNAHHRGPTTLEAPAPPVASFPLMSGALNGRAAGAADSGTGPAGKAPAPRSSTTAAGNMRDQQRHASCPQPGGGAGDVYSPNAAAAAGCWYFQPSVAGLAELLSMSSLGISVATLPPSEPGGTPTLGTTGGLMASFSPLPAATAQRLSSVGAVFPESLTASAVTSQPSMQLSALEQHSVLESRRSDAAAAAVVAAVAAAMGGDSGSGAAAPRASGAHPAMAPLPAAASAAASAAGTATAAPHPMSPSRRDTPDGSASPGPLRTILQHSGSNSSMRSGSSSNLLKSVRFSLEEMNKPEGGQSTGCVHGQARQPRSVCCAWLHAGVAFRCCCSKPGMCCACWHCFHGCLLHCRLCHCDLVMRCALSWPAGHVSCPTLTPSAEHVTALRARCRRRRRGQQPRRPRASQLFTRCLGC